MPPPPPPPYGRPDGPPPYQPYQNAGFGGYQPAMQRNNGLAVAGMVCGIVGILISCFFILPILAIIFGAVGRSQIRRQPQVFKGAGMATAGLVLGICGVAIYGVLLAVTIGRR